MNPSDETRSKITDLFEKFKPQLQGYYEYAQQVDALNAKYHECRLSELGVAVRELVLVASLDFRETPKSLDVALANLNAANVKIVDVVLDRKSGKYLLFSSLP